MTYNPPRNASKPPVTIPVGASPFTFTAPSDGIFVAGASLLGSMTHARGGVSTTIPAGSGQISMAAGDQITVTYTTAPTLTFIPI